MDFRIHTFLGPLTDFGFNRTPKAGLGEEEDGEQQAGTDNDSIHPEDPSPVRIGVVHETSENPTQ